MMYAGCHYVEIVLTQTPKYQDYNPDKRNFFFLIRIDCGFGGLKEPNELNCFQLLSYSDFTLVSCNILFFSIFFLAVDSIK